MATIFDVYPSELKLPTFEEVVDVAAQRLRERLSAMGIESELELRVTLRTCRGREEVVRPAEGPFQWQPGKEAYAWFEVVGLDGGCDVKYSEDREAIDVFRDEIKYNKTLPDDFVDRCLDLGRTWSFRRSAGQPATIALAYGYFAAALAELTEGFVYSDDGAWDREQLPLRPAEFYALYFYPEKTKEHVEWTTRCLEQLRLELRRALRP